MPKKLERPKMEASADDFVRVWGEAVHQKKAAMMMDVARSTICNYIAAGKLTTAPNGSVHVRSIHAYLYSL